MNRERQGEV